MWRQVRLAALTDAPAAFASTSRDERAIQEDGWRATIREAAVFVAVVDGATVGVVAGLYRASPEERGLGAMWVGPRWRGRGAAAMLVAAVAAWAQSEGGRRIELWVLEDNARARRFYAGQGFQMTGQRRPFPGSQGRFISQMSFAVHGDVSLEAR